MNGRLSVGCLTQFSANLRAPADDMAEISQSTSSAGKLYAAIPKPALPEACGLVNRHFLNQHSTGQPFGGRSSDYFRHANKSLLRLMSIRYFFEF